MAAILIPVVASEVDALTPEEREEIVATAVELTRGKIPVIGGASAGTLEQCLKYVESLTRAGCEGVLVNIPDMRDPAVREQYRNDHRCTDPAVAGDQLLPSYSKGNPEIDPEVSERLKKIWKKEHFE